MLGNALKGLVVLQLTCLLSTTVLGQSYTSRQLYGNGVHSFFAGRLQEATEYFNAAIGAGFQDPRCYYFRGLTALREGRSTEADEDFRTAATFEAKGVGGYGLDRALSRIQGHQRLRLERIRLETKLAQQQVPRDVAPPPIPT